MPGPWWWAKVAASVALVVHVTYVLLTGGAPSGPGFAAGQLLAVAGAAIYPWSAIVLRRESGGMAAPRHLVTRGALYSVVRHPLYLADILWTCGLALLAGTGPAFGLAAVAAVGAVMQARREDREMAALFPAEHAQWRARTGLIVPFLH